MTHTFPKYKQQEEKLQTLISSFNYTVSLEPITGTDIYYSDGAAAYSHGKAIFTKDKSEFVVFFPDFYCSYALPSSIINALQKWLNEIQ